MVGVRRRRGRAVVARGGTARAAAAPGAARGAVRRASARRPQCARGRRRRRGVASAVARSAPRSRRLPRLGCSRPASLDRRRCGTRTAQPASQSTAGASARVPTGCRATAGSAIGAATARTVGRSRHCEVGTAAVDAAGALAPSGRSDAARLQPGRTIASAISDDGDRRPRRRGSRRRADATLRRIRAAAASRGASRSATRACRRCADAGSQAALASVSGRSARAAPSSRPRQRPGVGSRRGATRSRARRAAEPLGPAAVARAARSGGGGRSVSSRARNWALVLRPVAAGRTASAASIARRKRVAVAARRPTPRAARAGRPSAARPTTSACLPVIAK